ncbi:MAG TPA: UDP-2,3-diacylglucosamine diphosphatase [Burkholderiales bacterium]|nr:UDP-2,3-diacylglucosamine diphosphatase [Burkholderiales bacterium]
MSRRLFISDLHLSSDQPQVSAQLFHFLASEARDAEALYILGDLFEVWLGDDAMEAPDGDPLAREVADALRAVRDTGTEILLMHGNRDFLLGERFAQACGARLIEDPTLLSLGNETWALMHGDTLCTEDHAYQKFRALARSRQFQEEFLSKPLAERRALAQAYRAKSEQVKRATPEEIMDVTPSAVEAVFRRHAASCLIHGHTHRPATHHYEVDGRHCERWVLPDWDRSGGYLVAEHATLRLKRL